jgi:hypothetical protein
VESARDRFETTLDLWATAIELRRQSLRREHPAVPDDEIERLINQWLTVPEPSANTDARNQKVSVIPCFRARLCCVFFSPKFSKRISLRR